MLDVKVLAEADALALLLRGAAGQRSPEEVLAATTICRTLGHLPLAIALAPGALRALVGDVPRPSPASVAVVPSPPDRRADARSRRSGYREVMCAVRTSLRGKSAQNLPIGVAIVSPRPVAIVSPPGTTSASRGAR
jgi:hypothetical protein